MDGRTLDARETIAPFRQSRPYSTAYTLSRYLRFANPEMWKAVERGLLAAGVPPE